MKHVTFADKSLLIGDTAALTMLAYAASLGGHDLADTVTLNAIGADGNDVAAVFLLNSGSPLMAETATTTVAEPDNAEAVAYMLGRLHLIESPPDIVANGHDAIDFDDPH